MFLMKRIARLVSAWLFFENHNSQNNENADLAETYPRVFGTVKPNNERAQASAFRVSHCLSQR
jgi:hypothetical protein